MINRYKALEDNLSKWIEEYFEQDSTESRRVALNMLQFNAKIPTLLKDRNKMQ